jgi:hypothetical protein
VSCLEATFTLTPQSPTYSDRLNNYANLNCYGADFWFYSPNDLSSLYASNRFFFDGTVASDPELDYTQWANRKKARFLQFGINLRGYAAAYKQLALMFGFDVLIAAFPGRVLVYSDAALLQDLQLLYGDNQVLLEIESLDQPLGLSFIHAGGLWFFRGLSGYVV